MPIQREIEVKYWSVCWWAIFPYPCKKTKTVLGWCYEFTTLEETSYLVRCKLVGCEPDIDGRGIEFTHWGWCLGLGSNTVFNAEVCSEDAWDKSGACDPSTGTNANPVLEAGENIEDPWFLRLEPGLRDSKYALPQPGSTKPVEKLGFGRYVDCERVEVASWHVGAWAYIVKGIGVHDVQTQFAWTLGGTGYGEGHAEGGWSSTLSVTLPSAEGGVPLQVSATDITGRTAVKQVTLNLSSIQVICKQTKLAYRPPLRIDPEGRVIQEVDIRAGTASGAALQQGVVTDGKQSNR